jgi:hypothetical protein
MLIDLKFTEQWTFVQEVFSRARAAALSGLPAAAIRADGESERSCRIEKRSPRTIYFHD